MNGTIPPMLTCQKLKAIHALKGMTQADLAHAAGVSPVTVATFESGKSDLRASTVLKLCEAMNVQVTYSVDGTVISGP